MRLYFQSGEMKLTCVTPIGSVTDKLLLDYDEEPLEIGFNNRFLLDAFKNTGESEVRMQLATSLAPMVLRPMEDDRFLFLILPVRLKVD